MKCSKICFQTKLAAQLLTMNPKRKECRLYWCQRCKAYHVTSQPYKKLSELKNKRKKGLKNETN